MNKLTIKEIKKIFLFTEKDLKERKEVSSYIQSLSTSIAEDFYKEYIIINPLFSGFFENRDIDRFVHQFTVYFNKIFSMPLDESFITLNEHIAQSHIDINLDFKYLNYGFNIIMEIIAKYSLVNEHIRNHIHIIFKTIRICIYIIQHHYENYFQQIKNNSQNNESFELLNKLYEVTIIQKNFQLKLENFIKSNFSNKKEIESLIKNYKIPLILEELKKLNIEDYGINTQKAIEYYNEFIKLVKKLIQTEKNDKEKITEIYRKINSVSKKIYNILNKPLEQVSTTSFLAINSAIKFLQENIEIINKIRQTNKKITIDFVIKNLKETLFKTVNWAIEDIKISKNNINLSLYDITFPILFGKNKKYLGIKLKNIPNKIFLKEIIKLILDTSITQYRMIDNQQEIIELAEKAERANRAKDIFLANMSHELRTPLNAIIGFSQILSTKSDTPEHIKPYIEKIFIAGKNLLQLVNTILDFAKLEAGKFKFNPETTNISDIINEVVTIIEPLANKKSIKFIYPKNISLALYIDRQLIIQALNNLLSNAIKFTPENGEVRLNIKYIKEKKEYLFSVCDTGIGMSKEDQAKIFDPFVQVENPFQKSTKGTGLGLTITKKIIELHKGKIWVESEKEKKTCFYFTIPVIETQNYIEQHPSSNKNAQNILIVEDNKNYQKILLDCLKDYNITLTNSINLAKKTLKNNKYYYIIIDFFLTDGIGTEILKYMEKENIFTPTIIVSAEDDKEIIQNIEEYKNIKTIFNKKKTKDICDFFKFIN
ncbi:hypothetical protein JCM11957_13940 [Caminibacter profundus]